MTNVTVKDARKFQELLAVIIAYRKGNCQGRPKNVRGVTVQMLVKAHKAADDAGAPRCSDVF